MLKQVFGLISIAMCLASGFVMAAGKCEISGHAIKGTLDFTVGGCVIEGTPKVEGGKVSGEFTVDTTKLDGGVRNEHMHEKYLETKKFPKATLKLDPMPEAGGPFTGKLTLHGVEKPIKGIADRSGSSVGYAFKFDINRKEFGIAEVSYKDILIGDNLTVTGAVDK